MGDNISMTCHRGTLAEFNTWHNAAMISDDIPMPDGRIGFVNGVPAPDNQRTIAYSKAVLHPSNANDYIWTYGDYPDGESLTLTEIKTAGWFPEEL